MTLYAGWEVDIKFTYGVYYMDGENKVSLGSYSVKSGEIFDDFQKFANKREDHTPLGYYSDPECTTAWSVDYKHPGGDKDLEIPVYVKYIEGDWELVDSFSKLRSAIYGSNVYLLCDIDGKGEELDTPGDFTKIFEGNGFTVSNFTVKKGGTTKTPTCSIFGGLSSSAVIRNVTFSDVSFDFTGIKFGTGPVTAEPKFATLAIDMAKGAKIESVSVIGTLTTNATEDFLSLESAYWFKTAPDGELDSGIKSFTADITVVKKS